MKILKLIKTIFKSKKIFHPLSPKKIFFFSNETFELFQDCFEKKQTFVYDRHFKKIYLRVLIKLFIKFRFKINHKEYFFEILRQVNPKFIISIIDNDDLIWQIKKKFKNIKVIIIQNGFRYKNNYDPYIENLKKQIDYESDIFFVFNKNIGNYYKNFFQSEIITSGSFANNKSLIKTFVKKTKSVMYISEWGPFKKHFHKNSEGYDKMNEACVFFVKILRDYCLKNNY